MTRSVYFREWGMMTVTPHPLNTLTWSEANMSNQEYITTQVQSVSPAYTAGFFDGEGSVYISVVHKTTRPASEIRKKDRKPRTRLSHGISHYAWLDRVCIGNTCLHILECFHLRWGGNIARSPARPNHKQMFQWSLSCRTAEMFIRDIFPFLVVKKPQAEIYLAFRETVGSPGAFRITDAILDKRIALIDTLRMLNLRGTDPQKLRPLILARGEEETTQWQMPTICIVNACTNKPTKMGLCNRHYLKQYRASRRHPQGHRRSRDSQLLS